MRNDYMVALTDLNGPVSFGGGGRSGGGGGGGGGRSRDTNATRNQVGSQNTTTVTKTPGQTVNREGKGDLYGGNNNQTNKGWSGCVKVDYNAKIVGKGVSGSGEICYGR